MHGYVPKRKKDAQDGQMSNENDESVANSVANLNPLNCTEGSNEGDKHVPCPYEGQICCSREGCIDMCYAGQLQPGVFYPRSTS